MDSVHVTSRPAADRIQTAGSRGYAWSLVVVLAFAYLLSTLDRFLVSVALEPIKSDLRLTDTQLGLLVGPAFAVSYALFCPALGRLADVANRCHLIAAGMLVWSLSTAAVAFSETFGSILAARAVVGMGEAALVPAATSLIATYFAREQLGRATSVFMAGSALGKAVAFIGGGALLALLTAAGGLYLGWRFSAWQALFILAAVPGAVLACFFLFLRDPERAKERQKAAAPPHLSQLLSHLSTRKQAYAFHIVAATICAMCNNVFLAWSPTFYVRKFALEPSTAAMLAGLATVVTGVAGFLIGGASMDALRRRGVGAAPSWIIAAALLLVIASCALFTLATSLWVSLVGYAIAQFAVQSTGAATMVGVQLLTPRPYRGFMIGAYLVILMLGALGTGPALVGLANDQLFAGGSLGWSILIVAAGFGALGVALAWGNTKAFGRAAVE